MLRTFALMLIASTGCMTEDTSSLESEATESTLSGTWVNPSPALYQVPSMFFGQGTFHMSAADLMDGNTVTRGVDADGFAYAEGAAGIRLAGSPVTDPSTLAYPWEESWVSGTHHAQLNADGSLTVSALQGPDGTSASAGVVLQPQQSGGACNIPPCN